MNEPLYRVRPGGDDIQPATRAGATPVAPGIWVSPGFSNSYLLTSEDGRVVVNTGMGFEGAVHRTNFDAIDPSPTRFILLTQGHYDHVGGVDVFRDPDTEVVAQANWSRWRDDNERLMPFRAANSAFAFADKVSAGLSYARARFGEAVPEQARPDPTITFEGRYDFQLGGRRFELHATPGGETTDSMVVWLPDERVCLTGNVFGPLFGHLPNLVTIRGDRYRDALTYVDSLELVRGLRPEVVLTGHFDPISGAELIDGELRRLGDAVRHLHDETVRGMNAGMDVRTLMREVVVPPELDVGEGYGKASWDVRAIWEAYAGWFHHRSTTELYATDQSAVHADLVELAGSDALVTRAAARLDDGRLLEAIHLAEVVLTVEPTNPHARAVMVAAHRALLAASQNFWESAWLRKQIEELSR